MLLAGLLTAVGLVIQRLCFVGSRSRKKGTGFPPEACGNDSKRAAARQFMCASINARAAFAIDVTGPELFGNVRRV